jgi:hypothetical protein
MAPMSKCLRSRATRFTFRSEGDPLDPFGAFPPRATSSLWDGWEGRLRSRRRVEASGFGAADAVVNTGSGRVTGAAGFASADAAAEAAAHVSSRTLQWWQVPPFEQPTRRAGIARSGRRSAARRPWSPIIASTRT